MRIALYQPDIPQNTGAILRMAACLNVRVDIIGPAGFDLSSRALKRAGLDYIEQAVFELHPDFDRFVQLRVEKEGARLVLATTKAGRSYLDHRFTPNDIVLMGRESCGVPKEVHEQAAVRVKVPQQTDTRSLNLAIAASIITSEALRQLQAFPPARIAE